MVGEIPQRCNGLARRTPSLVRQVLAVERDAPVFIRVLPHDECIHQSAVFTLGVALLSRFLSPAVMINLVNTPLKASQ